MRPSIVVCICAVLEPGPDELWLQARVLGGDDLLPNRNLAASSRLRDNHTNKPHDALLIRGGGSQLQFAAPDMALWLVTFRQQREGSFERSVLAYGPLDKLCQRIAIQRVLGRLSFCNGRRSGDAAFGSAAALTASAVGSVVDKGIHGHADSIGRTTCTAKDTVVRRAIAERVVPLAVLPPLVLAAVAAVLALLELDRREVVVPVPHSTLAAAISCRRQGDLIGFALASVAIGPVQPFALFVQLHVAAADGAAAGLVFAIVTVLLESSDLGEARRALGIAFAIVVRVPATRRRLGIGRTAEVMQSTVAAACRIGHALVLPRTRSLAHDPNPVTRTLLATVCPHALRLLGDDLPEPVVAAHRQADEVGKRRELSTGGEGECTGKISILRVV